MLIWVICTGITKHQQTQNLVRKALYTWMHHSRRILTESYESGHMRIMKSIEVIQKTCYMWSTTCLLDSKIWSRIISHQAPRKFWGCNNIFSYVRSIASMPMNTRGNNLSLVTSATFLNNWLWLGQIQTLFLGRFTHIKGKKYCWYIGALWLWHLQWLLWIKQNQLKYIYIPEEIVIHSLSTIIDGFALKWYC